MPDFGIGEALAGGGLLDALFGGAAAAAPVAADVAATAPLDLLAGGAAAGTAAPLAAGAIAPIGAGLGTLGGAAGLGAGADLGAGLGLAAPGAAGLSDAAISSLEGSTGANAFASTNALADPSAAITGAGPGGVGGVANPGLSLGTIDPSLGQVGPSVADTLTSPDFTTLAGTPGTTYGSTGVGAVPPSNVAAAAPAAGGGSPFPTPSVFDTGGPATPGAGGWLGPGGAAATAPPAASPGVLSSIGSTLKDIAPVAGVAGLGLTGYNAYEQNQQLKALQATETKYQNDIAAAGAAATQAAQPLLTSGEALTQYLQNGTLPTGLQKVVDQFKASAKAARIQAAANMGQSTDPKFNTALGQDLAAIDSQADQLTVQFEQQLQQSGTQMVQTATNLISQGVSATNIASQLPIAVQNLNLALAKTTSAAISSFAAALNGRSPVAPGTGQITINTSTGAIA